MKNRKDDDEERRRVSRYIRMVRAVFKVRRRQHIPHYSGKYSRNDLHLNEFHTRLRRKRGESRARIAVATKLVSYAYWMIKRNKTYEGLSPWRSWANTTWRGRGGLNRWSS